MDNLQENQVAGQSATPAGQPAVQVAVQVGIACPGCGAVENYGGRTNDKRPDNSIYRTKNCKSCGQVFSTIEVPIAMVAIKRRQRGDDPQPIPY